MTRDCSVTVRAGVDLQSIQRFRELDGPVGTAVRERVFTDAERKYCEGTGDPDQHYAARWAAREAFQKVVETPAVTSAVAVERSGDAPRLALSEVARGRLTDALGTASWEAGLSLSHDRTADVALAQVVVVGEL